MVLIAGSLLLLPSLLHSLTPSNSVVNIQSSPFTIIFAEAADVQWKGNDNVSPEHKAAHEAPRSQKYWDEHGIERPDYAKTDAEIAAERRQRGETSAGIGMGLFGFIFLIMGIFAMASITYASITGDWDTITKNPVGYFVVNCINRMAEVTGVRGHKLGSSSTGGDSASDEEARRLARLARFDNQNQVNMLDNMKSE
eukprot:CAMPEP_0183726904 /NCGR_PEP_ID=MMETSP0737-20130205/24390_1 /TAXON_ID=385413 /ORGANISM="Thalassiosira miniscula, Strain CCMP1093" /LENGTH=196 /DNA_ID=CAMNT_0025958375 /DNA_START=40 /DNA_END=630 /DNA_ORIENTATION=+